MRQGGQIRFLLPLIPGVALFAAPAGGYEIDYSADRAAELRACDAHYFRGRKAEARSCFSALLAAGTAGQPPLRRVLECLVAAAGRRA